MLDANNGTECALVQAREFCGCGEDVSGIMSYRSWTVQPRAVLQLQSSRSWHIPVKYIGVGETIDDLQKFDSDEFVNALFDIHGRK